MLRDGLECCKRLFLRISNGTSARFSRYRFKDRAPTHGVADGRPAKIPGRGCKTLHNHGSYPACNRRQPTVSFRPHSGQSTPSTAGSRCFITLPAPTIYAGTLVLLVHALAPYSRKGSASRCLRKPHPAQAKLLRDSIVQQPLRYKAGLSRNAAAHPRDRDAPTSLPFAPSVHAFPARALKCRAQA